MNHQDDQEGPKVGSRPGPDPERVAAKLHDKLTNEQPLSLEAFWNMAKDSGAVFMGLEATEEGDVIALKGYAAGDNIITASLTCPVGHAFPTYARAVLESFRESPVDGARVERTSLAEPIPTIDDTRTAEGKVDQVAIDLNVQTAPNGGGHGSIKSKPNPDAPTTFRQHTSTIKKADGSPQYRHQAGKKPPSAAGMCVECEVQPTMHAGSQFCGARCAKQWHMRVLAKRQGVNLPRHK